MSNTFSQCFLLFIFLCSSSIYSQRSKSESTTSIYFSVPEYDISISLSELSYSFAMDRTSFKKPKSFEAEEVCVASGSKNVLKDAKKIAVYRYSVPAEIKDSYLIVENSSGDIVYAEEINSYQRTGSLVDETINLVYGDEECYWHPQVLEEAWKKDKDEWKKQQHQKIKERFIEKARHNAVAALSSGYVRYGVNVYTARGGKYDYAALDEAQSQAIRAYEDISKNGKVTLEGTATLKAPIETWLSHLEQVNLVDNKSKINKKVAQGLYMNLATAYFQMRDFDEASKYLEAYEDAHSNAVMRGSDQSVRILSNLILAQRKGLAINTNLTNDYKSLNQLKVPTNFEVKIEDLGESMADELSGRYYFYSKDKEKEAKIEASGSIYKSNISQGQYGPTLVMMTVYDGDLEEFPLEVTELDVKGMVFTGGYSFKSLPPEIGNMTNLEQIILSDSEVSDIPDEIGNLTNLKRFNLSRTKVSTLPESMKNLKNLKMLNIKKTNISASELAKIKSWLPNCKIKF